MPNIDLDDSKTVGDYFSFKTSVKIEADFVPIEQVYRELETDELINIEDMTSSQI